MGCQYHPAYKNSDKTCINISDGNQHNVIFRTVSNFKFHEPCGSAVVDIFRVKDGKIVEYWDVAQDIPETMTHDNGMF
ncbi:MAG: hypothetical protein CSA44_02410 [Gammaproteobacteria bacterium]|nr:MAG: hypothetical protein CSA44_02410 [Gammaproteobacteria bacterium]